MGKASLAAANSGAKSAVVMATFSQPLPQALRIVLPPLGNSVNGLLKTTSIASVISMEEVLRRGQILMQQKFQVLEVFIVVAIIYLAMTTCWDFVQRRIEAYYGKAYGAAADHLAEIVEGAVQVVGAAVAVGRTDAVKREGRRGIRREAPLSQAPVRVADGGGQSGAVPPLEGLARHRPRDADCGDCPPRL